MVPEKGLAEAISVLGRVNARRPARTVGTHIEHIFRKLGVRTRAQAVAAAFREGLVELPS